MSAPSPVLTDTGLVDLGDQAATLEVLSASVLGLWEVVNNLTRLRPTRREQFRVTIFGSARTQESSPDYKQAAEFGKAMAAAGWMVITGAGGGIMAAGHGGAGGSSRQHGRRLVRRRRRR